MVKKKRITKGGGGGGGGHEHPRPSPSYALRPLERITTTLFSLNFAILKKKTPNLILTKYRIREYIGIAKFNIYIISINNETQAHVLLLVFQIQLYHLHLYEFLLSSTASLLSLSELSSTATFSKIFLMQSYFIFIIVANMCLLSSKYLTSCTVLHFNDYYQRNFQPSPCISVLRVLEIIYILKKRKTIAKFNTIQF